MNDDIDYQEKINQLVSDNDDGAGHKLHYLSGQNINQTERYTDTSNFVNNQQLTSNSNIDQTPTIFRYKDNKQNLGDLSPFGEMRRRTFSQRAFGPM